ncbi:epimerase [Streptomyces sulfonofaciens]|uniref:Epimerase n=1 Tax=Streptomyces sulfonofaciens TaxID=68272 RepID=A0A919G6D9_9ACTN|nr:epimerase [Streptomyces sulfonofaciens]GHH79117.1 epimerase [Streptomyces sulfonofaciens]
MKVVLFGASGMVGHGALAACLDNPGVTEVVAVVRRPLGLTHPKLREVVHDDFTDLTGLADDFAGTGACFFCLGTSSAGRTEAEYTRITRDYALAAAEALLPVRPAPVFVYVSGEGADRASRTMWARVKGTTEDALHELPLRTHVVRPGYIRPVRGARSRTRSYRLMYAATSWLYPVLRRLMPRHTTTTEALGRAMLALARQDGREPRLLTSAEVNALAGRP